MLEKYQDLLSMSRRRNEESSAFAGMMEIVKGEAGIFQVSSK